jgi:predicted phosphodiesterase
MGKIWTEEKVAVLQAYLDAELTYEEIAKKMDKTLDSIDHAIRRYKIRKTRVATKVPKLSKEELQKVQTASTLERLDKKYFESVKKKARIDWTIRKTKVKPIKGEKPFQTFLVTSDYHVPEHNMTAIKSILYMMDDVKFDGFINLGDFMDLGCISHWNKQKKLTSEGMKLREDYIEGNAILDEFDKRLPEGSQKYFMYGNHEDWYYQFIELNPSLEGLFEPKHELHLAERGYKVYDRYNDIFSIGKLSFTHGIYAGLHYAKKHLDELSTNIMFGHLHSGRLRFKSSAAKQLSLAGYALGCLCDMSPDYMRNRPNDWTHGFAVVYFFEDGSFDVDLKRIVKGKFVYNGKLYDGNRK